MSINGLGGGGGGAIVETLDSERERILPALKDQAFKLRDANRFKKKQFNAFLSRDWLRFDRNFSGRNGTIKRQENDTPC